MGEGIKIKSSEIYYNSLFDIYVMDYLDGDKDFLNTEENDELSERIT